MWMISSSSPNQRSNRTSLESKGFNNFETTRLSSFLKLVDSGHVLQTLKLCLFSGGVPLSYALVSMALCVIVKHKFVIHSKNG